MIYSVITNAWKRKLICKHKVWVFQEGHKIDEISTLDLMLYNIKSKVEIFVAFLENLKFTYIFFILDWWFLDLNKEEVNRIDPLQRLFWHYSY